MSKSGTGRPNRGELLLLLLAAAAGLLLRAYALGEVPAGLYQDEAYNGLDALQVIAGERPLYFEANNGREPLFIYLEAVAVAVLGRSVLALRLPAAILGWLTILAAYALGRAWFNRRVGLLTALITAVNFWAVASSRTAFRAVALPLFCALSLAAAAWGWRSRRPEPVVAGGVLCGLSAYTYLAARAVPPVLIAFLVFWYIARRQTFPSAGRLAAFVLPAAACCLPLAILAIRQPALILGRAGQVSIFADGGGEWPATIFYNGLKAAGMFVWRGDDIGRHNLPGRPVFDWLMGAAFVAGALDAVYRAVCRRHLPSALALIWTGGMLLPTILAEDVPHFLRAVGILPVIYLFPALALERLWQADNPARRIGRAAFAGEYDKLFVLLKRGLVCLVLIGSGLYTVRDYFGRYANDADTAYWFQRAVVDLAQRANAYLSERSATGFSSRRLFIERRYWEHFPQVRFLVSPTAGLSVIADGQPPAIDGADEVGLIVWPYQDLRPVLAALPAGWLIASEAGHLYADDPGSGGEPYSLFTMYTASRNIPPAAVAGPAAEFAGGLRLISAAAERVSGGARLRLVWETQNGLNRDYQVFVHVLAGGEIAAQADGPLGEGRYPSVWWRPGERVAEERRIELEPRLAAADLKFRVGVYDLASGARLPREDTAVEWVDIVPVD